MLFAIGKQKPIASFHRSDISNKKFCFVSVLVKFENSISRSKIGVLKFRILQKEMRLEIK